MGIASMKKNKRKKDIKAFIDYEKRHKKEITAFMTGWNAGFKYGRKAEKKSINGDFGLIRDNILGDNKHHLFKCSEVKKKIIEIFGIPKTDAEHNFIDGETSWAWKRMPCYILPIDKHKLIHFPTKKSSPRDYRANTQDLKQKLLMLEEQA